MKINQIKNKYNTLNDIFKLVINAAILLLIWIIFYSFLKNIAWIKEIYELMTIYFTNFLTNATKLSLNLIGYEAEVVGKIVRIVGTYGVYLDKGCLARNLMGIFAGFVIAYPGKIKHKLWFVPMGIFIIIILNIFRLSGLAILVECCPEKVEFNHHYVFKIIVFAFTFLLWYIWVFKIVVTKNKPTTFDK